MPWEAKEQLGSLLTQITATLSWPTQVLCNYIVFLGKPGPSPLNPAERTIALTSGLYRLQTKIAGPELADWEEEHRQIAWWDMAVRRSSALCTAVAR